jgi:hypothetical protein
MKTYFYTETDSRQRGKNKHIAVWRIRKNKPELLGTSEHTTASWKGARPCACDIIHNVDGIPYAIHRDGTPNNYELRNMYGFADLYTVAKGSGIRLFSC